ncbi:MAG TPA: hypothetical protein VLM89_03480, partial [Phycisphaerae bacterium]|nr:hypothetical protein [Phycisphaerae bacterium]
IPAAPGIILMAYGSIVRDPRLDKYVAFVRGRGASDYYRVTSPDGLNWDAARQEQLTPVTFDMSLQQEPGARGNPGLDLFSCWYNQKDKDHPYQGWMYYANFGNNREGIYYVRSRDGLTWERGPLVVNAWAGQGDASCRVITQDGKTVYGPGDVTLFYHDPVTDRFLGLFKFFTDQDAGEGNNLRSRAYLFLDRLDEPVDTNRIQRIALLPPAADRDGDFRFDEYYASTAWRYESLWLGGLKVYHFKGDYPFSAAGCAFMKLVVSRDGLNWKKVRFNNDAGVPEVFIPNGPEGGNNGQNDGGYMCEFSQGPLRIGDELIYYYTCSSYGKNHERGKRVTGGGLFRARLRVDGFVSVDGGILTTKPISFEGDDLFVNGIGPIVVQAIGLDGTKLGENTVSGDSLRHRVTFDGKTLRQLTTEGTVRLSFNVRPGGQLYSFSVR